MNFSTNSVGEKKVIHQVQHAIVSKPRLIIDLDVVSQSDITDCPIFPGVMGKDVFDAADYADSAGQGVKVIFKAEGFANIAEYCKYFSQAKVAIEGVKMYSTDTANFSSEFVHVEKYAFGRDPKEGFEPIENYRVPLSNGWSNDLTIPADKLVWRLWYGLKIGLSKLKAGSKVRLQFNVVAQDKSMDATLLDASVIR